MRRSWLLSVLLLTGCMAGPAPTSSSTATAVAGPAGPGGSIGPLVSATSPPMPATPVGLGMAADGQGWLYALGREAWLEDPNGGRKRLFDGAGVDGVLAIDPRLRFVVATETIVPVLPPGTAPRPVAPRLVYVPLGAGERREIVPATPGLTLRLVTLSPDGRWLALPIDGEPDQGRADALLRIDLETPGAAPTTWQAGTRCREVAWSPDGRRVAFLGDQAWTLGLDETTPSPVAGGGAAWLGFLPDGRLVATAGDPLTFDGRLRGRITGPAGDAPAPFAWRVGPEGTIAEARSLSPVGTQLLVEVRDGGGAQRRHGVLDLADGALTTLSASAHAPRWRPDGTLACDGDAEGQPVACGTVP